jgi:hypothetical protein
VSEKDVSQELREGKLCDSIRSFENPCRLTRILIIEAEVSKLRGAFHVSD